MNQKLDAICREVQKALTGKRAIVEKVLMAMLCGGHILLDDVPGVGKTTLAVAFSKALGLRYRRIQFTPDVLPSDIVGFSMYDKQQNAFRYVPGIVSDTNLLLADEINRTSSKTQSALLEAMEEKQVTVDGICYPLPDPFCVIATQNQVGTAGTQPLPNAQMDRFLVQLTIGYPDYESQMTLIRDRQLENPMEQVQQAADAAALVSMQQEVRRVAMDDKIIDYITRLAMASRAHPLLRRYPEWQRPAHTCMGATIRCRRMCRRSLRMSAHTECCFPSRPRRSRAPRRTSCRRFCGKLRCRTRRFEYGRS